MAIRRKIGFYTLSFTNDFYSITDHFYELLQRIIDKERVHRRFFLGADKFCLVDLFQRFNDTQRSEIIFKSALKSFRPPLIDGETVEERDNPKRLEEGERHKTHVVTKFYEGEVLLLVEKYKDSLSINQIVKYLNHFIGLLELDEPVRITYDVIVKDNFEEEIDALSRVVSAEVIVDKQILGGDALNYSQNLNPIKHEVSICVKCERKKDISRFVKDVVAKWNGGREVIRKIKIVGKTEENNDINISTEFIELQEYIDCDVELNTGEIATHNIFLELNTIIFRYN